jgi:hypothetical protein
VPDNLRRGRPQGKCHRKQTASPDRRRTGKVRVKGCGKSAPRPWQQGRHGKPHREQDQIGAARRPKNRQSISRRAARVGCRRRRVSGAPDEWPSSRAFGRGIQNPAYRPGDMLWLARGCPPRASLQSVRFLGSAFKGFMERKARLSGPGQHLGQHSSSFEVVEGPLRAHRRARPFFWPMRASSCHQISMGLVAAMQLKWAASVLGKFF